MKRVTKAISPPEAMVGHTASFSGHLDQATAIHSFFNYLKYWSYSTIETMAAFALAHGV